MVYFSDVYIYLLSNILSLCIMICRSSIFEIKKVNAFTKHKYIT